jgi:hypothetical protein
MDFNVKDLETISDDPTLWRPEGYGKYEAELPNGYSVAVWRSRNAYTKFLTRRVVERPTYHCEVYMATGRALERHRLATAVGDEVKRVYERIAAAKTTEWETPAADVEAKRDYHVQDLTQLLRLRRDTTQSVFSPLAAKQG